MSDLSQPRGRVRKELKAAEQAHIPYYRAIGELLRGEIGNMTYLEFLAWASRHLRLTHSKTRDCLEAAGVPLSTVKPPDGGFHPKQTHTGPSAEDFQRARNYAVEEARDRIQEREEQAKAGLEIIKAGYRAMAAKHHPDRGGSQEAMTRLNKARERLRANV
jgi:hypothetical protein